MQESYQHQIDKVRHSNLSDKDKAKYIRAWKREAFMDKFLHSTLFTVLISATTTILTVLLVAALLTLWR